MRALAKADTRARKIATAEMVDHYKARVMTD